MNCPSFSEINGKLIYSCEVLGDRNHALTGLALSQLQIALVDQAFEHAAIERAQVDRSASVNATITIPVRGRSELAFTAASSVVAELFAVDLARANGVVPGAFIHGSKITTTV